MVPDQELFSFIIQIIFVSVSLYKGSMKFIKSASNIYFVGKKNTFMQLSHLGANVENSGSLDGKNKRAIISLI